MTTCPVDRTVIEFDHHAPEHVRTSVETFRRLREQAPVAWSPHYGGFWLVTRYDDVMQLTRDPDAFLSDKAFDENGQPHGGVTIPPSYLWMVPTETDKPDWLRYRTALAPLFTPAPVAANKALCEQFTHELIDRVIETGEIDLVLDLVNPVPSLMTMHVLGLPIEEWQRFTVPFHKKAYAEPGSAEEMDARRGIEWFLAYMRDQIVEQRRTRRPGLISYLMDAKVSGESRLGAGERLNDREIFMLALQVIAGGVDTTTALTSNTLVYLDQDRAARQRLIEDPSLLPKACEEFMRLASPVQALCRTAARDLEIGGQPIKAGERIMFAFASANRDNREFADPDRIQVDRFPNRHLGFGIGSHRCIGSTFARMMFGVMLGAILERLPDYRIDHDRAAHYPTMPAVNGWQSIPASFTPGLSRSVEKIIPAWKATLDFADVSSAPGLSVADLLSA